MDKEKTMATWMKKMMKTMTIRKKTRMTGGEGGRRQWRCGQMKKMMNTMTIKRKRRMERGGRKQRR